MDPQHLLQLPHLQIRDELAAELGVLPSWWELLRQGGPRLLYLYYFGPALSFYYRLKGPHSWTGAGAAIANSLCEQLVGSTPIFLYLLPLLLAVFLAYYSVTR